MGRSVWIDHDFGNRTRSALKTKEQRMPLITAQDMTGAAQPAEQTTTNEVSQATPAEATPKVTDETMSPKFAALARQQKALRQQQRAFEEQRRAFETDKQAREAEREEALAAKAWKQRLTQDPYSVMLESGLTADQVAALMLNQPNPADQRVQLLEQEIKALKASQDKTNSKFDEVQQKQRADAINQISADVKILVDSDESFEIIKAMNAQEAVVDWITHIFDTEGKLMTNEEAAKEIEDYLVEEAFKLTKLKKVQSRLTPPPAEVPKQQTIQKPQMQTLSNRMVQSVTNSPSTSRARRERAIAAFMGNKTT